MMKKASNKNIREGLLVIRAGGWQWPKGIPTNSAEKTFDRKFGR